MITCDDVFEILTRGPFPSGSPDDQAVESHLCQCSDCARLAQALQPALSILHEAMDADEASELPEYWGQLLDDPDFSGLPAAEPSPLLLAEQDDQLPPQGSAAADHRSLWGWLIGSVLAASLLVTASLGGFWYAQLGIADGSDESRRTRPMMATTLADLPTVCREAPADRSNAAQVNQAATRLALAEHHPGWQLHSRSGHLQQCCTQCHTAGGRAAAAQVTIAELTRSCVICHVGMN